MDKTLQLESTIKALEEQLAFLKSEKQVNQIFRSIIGYSLCNIILLDLDARIQFINHVVPGFKPGELIGRHLPDLVDPHYRPRIKKALEHVASTGESGRYEMTYTYGSGEISWWESNVGAVIEDSKITGFVVVSNNVTEQRKTSEEQERFFNLSAEMMCIVGFDGKFKLANKSFKDTLGYTDEQLNRPFQEFIHPADIKASEEIFSTLTSGTSIKDFENRFITSNGSSRLLSWRSSADVKRELVYAVARDITEEKDLQEQLQQARRLEAVGQLAGGIAHDFNNLLASIQGNVELAQVNAEYTESALSEILKASDKSATLIHQLLTFSHSKPLSPSTLKLGTLLENVLSLLERLLPENISLNLKQPIEGHAVLADQSQLEQVIVNLCVNARDAMPQGGALEITVGETPVGKPPAFGLSGMEEYIVLSVTDTGSGMSDEVLKHIFEPFFTTKSVGKGTGLGLATVYSIVKQHKGFVDVESKPGQGSTFRVYLPRITTVLNPEGHSLKSTPISAEQVTGGTETILIAEDDTMLRRVLVRILEQAGYTVLIAEDGLEAVSLFAENRDIVALALLDVVMPTLGGLEAASRLREIHSELSIVFVSGYVQSENDKTQLAGETLFPKPYKRNALLKLIRKTLDSKT